MVAAVETMAYAGAVPWHGLGVEVIDDLTPEQILVKAGLDWNVLECDTYVSLDGNTIPTGKKALVRDSDYSVLTEVGPNWEPLQNSEAFEFFTEFVMAGDMKMNTAGSLKDGQIVWGLAKVNDGFTLFGGDEVESFMLFSNPHQYGKSINVMFTPIRVVCNNTLTMALGADALTRVTVNHCRKFDAEAVKETMGLVATKMDNYKEAAEFLGSKQYTDKSLEKFMGEIFGTKPKAENELTRTAKKVVELVEEQPGSNFAPGSWWQAYNAVTYYTVHVSGRSADTRLQSSWFGVNQRRKLDAMNTVLEYADAA